MKVRLLAPALFLAVLSVSAHGEEKAVPKEAAPKEAADDEPRPARGHVERIVPIKDVDRMRVFRELAGAFGVSGVEFRDLGFMVLRGPAQAVANAEAAIAKYDVIRPASSPRDEAARNVEITAYLLIGGESSGRLLEAPAVLAPVVTQLKERFPYKTYSLLESVILRVGARGGKGEAGGVLPPLLVPEQRNYYTFNVDRVDVRDGTPAVVSIGMVRLGLEVAIPKGGNAGDFHHRGSAINTGVDIRAGQKVVLGKTTLDGTNNALILVLMANVVE